MFRDKSAGDQFLSVEDRKDSMSSNRPHGRVAMAGTLAFTFGVSLVVALTPVNVANAQPTPEMRCGDVGYGIEIDARGRLLAAAEVGTSTSFTAEDGDVVQAKDWAVTRFTPSGQIDPSFGTGGSTVLDAGGDDEVLDIRIDSVGRALVMGRVNTTNDEQSIAVARLDRAGALDRTYGVDGFARIDVAPRTFAWAAAVDDRDRLVLAGRIGVSEASDFAVFRLLANGQPDRRFGERGVVRIDRGDPAEVFESLTVEDRTGRILAAGSRRDSGITEVLALRSNGQPDGSFGRRGWVTLPENEGETRRATGLTVDRFGRTSVVSDLTENDETRGIAVTRLTRSGQLDRRFGDAGQVVTAVPNSFTFVWDSALVNRGGDRGQRLVTVGTDFAPGFGSNRPFALALAPNGVLDRGFGDKGVARVDIPTPFGFFADLEALRDGSMVAVGAAIQGPEAGDSDLLVTKLDNAGRPVGSFGTGGSAIVDLRGPVCGAAPAAS